MGGGGAATVVIAHPDHGGRELLARIVEAAGHDAVRIDATAPPELVDTTVESSALVLVVDVTAIGFPDLDSVVGAFATRRYPARVVALVDGPASAASATKIGAAAALERPFHRDVFVDALGDLLDTAPQGRNGPDREVGARRIDPGDGGEPEDGAAAAQADPNFGIEFDVERNDPEPDGEPHPEPRHRSESSEVAPEDDPRTDSGDDDEPGEGSEPEPQRPPPVDHSFTDILRMGRQL